MSSMQQENSFAKLLVLRRNVALVLAPHISKSVRDVLGDHLKYLSQLAPATLDGLDTVCKNCKNEAQRLRFQNASPEYLAERKRRSESDSYRNTVLTRLFRISLDEYNTMVLNQRDKCAICQKDFLDYSRRNVDHDHTTNKVRGLLCRKCNFALGHFKNSIPNMWAAVNYLYNASDKYSGIFRYEGETLLETGVARRF